jgi:hypothetical protein
MAKMSLSVKNGDPKKKTPSEKSVDSKSPSPKANVSLNKKPSMDSVKVARQLLNSPTYKGKKLDPTNPSIGGRVKRLIGEHVRPMLDEGDTMRKMDSIYYANKEKDINYPGVSAREGDKVMEKGKAGRLIEAHGTYQDYRKVFPVGSSGAFEGVTQPTVKYAPPSFGGGAGYEEEVYVPDPKLKRKIEETKEAKKAEVKKTEVKKTEAKK